MKANADRARGLDAAEVAKELRESAEQMFRLRFQLVMGQTDGLKKLRALRKERARILTVQRERELAAAEGAKPVAPAKAAPAKKAAVKKVAVKKTAAVKAEAKPAVKKAAAPKAVKAENAAAPKAAKAKKTTEKAAK